MRFNNNKKTKPYMSKYRLNPITSKTFFLSIIFIHFRKNIDVYNLYVMI